MNGFLVLVRCGRDDIPFRLCATREAADMVAKDVRLGEVEEVLRRLSIDVSCYCNVSVVTFVDGAFVDCDCVRDFDDEDDCEFPSGLEALPSLEESEVPPA